MADTLSSTLRRGTAYKNRATIDAVVAQMVAADADSTYTVVDLGDGRFVIQVKDEDGNVLGVL